MSSVETRPPRLVGDRAVAIRHGERALREEDQRADRLAVRTCDRRDHRRAQRAVAPVAAVPPADRQAGDALLRSSPPRRPGGAGGAGAVVVAAEPDVREHAAAVRDGDGAVAQQRVRLLGQDARAGRREARPQRRARGLDDLQDACRRRLAERHDARRRRARTRPIQSTSASVGRGDDRHEQPAATAPSSWIARSAQ